MPNIGELLTLKIDKVIKTGAFLSNKSDRFDYFLPITEVKDGWIESMEGEVTAGEEKECRVVGVKRKKGRLSYQVSLKMADDEVYKREVFNQKLEKFKKVSQDKQTQLKKNKERKYNNGRKKPKKVKKNTKK